MNNINSSENISEFITHFLNQLKVEGTPIAICLMLEHFLTTKSRPSLKGYKTSGFARLLFYLYREATSREGVQLAQGHPVWCSGLEWSSP